MTKPVRFTQVTAALAACIAAAPEAEKAALAAALEAYAATFSTSFRDLTSSTPAMGRMIQAIEEASEARINLK